MPGIELPASVTRLSAAEFRGLTQQRVSIGGTGVSTPLSPKARPAAGASGAGAGKAGPASVPVEHEEQRDLVSWLRSMGIRFSATPSGGHRAIKTAKALKAEGVVPGVPDITVWPPVDSGLPIVFLEMKRQKKGKISPHQKEWLDYLNRLADVGYPIRAAVAKGFAEARDILTGYGYVRRL